MNTPHGRYIHSRSSPSQISELLQTVFIGELLCSSKCIWLVSPWISDIPILDNRSNQFLFLEPDWSRSGVHISMVLDKLLDLGATVHIATRPVDHNLDFLNRMESRRSSEPRLKVHKVRELHEKGILGDGYYLMGSMNFTHNGVSINEEAIHFSTDPAIVAEAAITFSGRWGGVGDSEFDRE